MGKLANLEYDITVKVLPWTLQIRAATNLSRLGTFLENFVLP
jgi:hypothetical protein